MFSVAESVQHQPAFPERYERLQPMVPCSLQRGANTPQELSDKTLNWSRIPQGLLAQVQCLCMGAALQVLPELSYTVCGTLYGGKDIDRIPLLQSQSRRSNLQHTYWVTFL